MRNRGYRPGEFVGRCDDMPVLDRSRHYAVENFMPDDWAGAMLSWCQEHYDMMTRSGHERSFQSSAALRDLASHCPEINVFIDTLLHYVVTACMACDVQCPGPDTPLFIESWLSHRGEGDHFHWHTDRDPIPEQTRLLTFCYYMHNQPRRFMGGELEFFDGVMLEPRHNSLVMFNPMQMHRVRHVHGVPLGWGGSDEDGTPPSTWPDVEDLHYVDGRWNVTGWVHLKEPTYDEGY